MALRFTIPNTIVLSVAAATILGRYTHMAYTGPSILTRACIIFLIINAARFVWACYIYPHYWSPLRRLPGPPDRPSILFGHFWQMFDSEPGVVLRTWANSVPNKGIIRYLVYFNLERLAIVSPAALADVLVHNCYDFEKPEAMRTSTSFILGDGLFLAEGDAHRKQRKLLMPAFAYRRIKNLYPMFWDKSREMMAAILASNRDSDRVDGGKDAIIEVSEWAGSAALDIIGQGGFGQSFNAIQDPDNALSRTYRTLFRPGRAAQLLGVLGWLLPQWVVQQLPFLRNNKMKQGSNFIRSFCRSSIETKRRKPKTELEDEHDILAVAMGSGAFTDEDLVNQMMTFLAAGHETTATALTWAVYIIAKYPQIQNELRKEVRSLLPPPLDDTSSTVTAETIEKMPYLKAVTSEVLRLFSPVSVTVRVAVRDTTICSQPIAKGTNVMIPPWAVNGSTELWGADAAEFVPERWLRTKSTDDDPNVSSSGGKGTNYNYLTFLHGPRACIGRSFAEGELSCLLAAWVGAFETELEDPDFVPVAKGMITAKPKGGVHVRVKPLGIANGE